VNGRHRQPHRLGERVQVRGREAAESILDAMEVLDEVIGFARRALEKARDLLARGGIDRAALRNRARPADLRNGDRDFVHGAKTRLIKILGYSPGAFSGVDRSQAVRMVDMCRALLYLGKPVLLDHLLFQPDSAL